MTVYKIRHFAITLYWFSGAPGTSNIPGVWDLSFLSFQILIYCMYCTPLCSTSKRRVFVFPSCFFLNFVRSASSFSFTTSFTVLNYFFNFLSCYFFHLFSKASLSFRFCHFSVFLDYVILHLFNIDCSIYRS